MNNYLRLLSSFLIFSFSALALAGQLGQPGRMGRSGMHGVPGRTGQDVQIAVDGRALSLALDGGNGTNGEMGEQGGDAMFCYHNQPAENLYGAEGGTGGDGGNAGAGGRGGDIVAFFTDEAQLKSIYVTAMGGAAGRSAMGGYGGRGCQCMPSSWSKRICHTEIKDGKPVEVCVNQQFYCNSGQNGRTGRNGMIGIDGRMGRLYLVKNLTQIPREIHSDEFTVADLDNRSIVLSDNIWDEKSGALSKLAPGSRLNDRYVEFVQHREYPMRFSWKAPRPLSLFASHRAQVSLTGAASKLQFDANFFVFVDYSVVSGVEQFLVTEAANENEFKNVTAVIEGNKKNTVLHLVDKNPLPRLTRDVFNLTLERSAVLGWSDVFKGAVPENLISRNGENIIINLAGLPGADPDKDFKAKRKVRVSLKIDRHVDPYATQAEIPRFEHEIK